MTQSTFKKSTSIKKGSSRRKFLFSSAAALTAASWPLILTPGSSKAAGTLYHAGWGGSYNNALHEIFFRPFEKATGIKVVTSGPPDMAKLKASVQAGNVEWDMIEPLPTQVGTAANEGLLEPIDYGIVDLPSDDVIFPLGLQEYWIGFNTYMGGIGYHEGRFPDGKHPSTWRDFWDVEKFPGRRGLRKRPNDTLEIALMGAGMATKDIYPIDVDAAFASLEVIQPHLKLWYKTPAESISLLLNDELDFTFTYAGRVFNARKEGAPLRYSLDQVINLIGILAVPKGAKRKDDAMRLLNFMSLPERQAAFCDFFTNPPIRWSALPLVSDEMREHWIPDYKNPNHLTSDPHWWAQPNQLSSMVERFNEFLLT